MIDIEGLKAQLISEYSPALDTSLVFAICSDFDFADPSQLKAARDTLDELQKSAGKEEATGFDASASSGSDALVHNGREDHWDCSESSSEKRSWSRGTDDTELTYGISAMEIDGSSASDKNEEEVTYGAELDTLHPDAKESILLEMFPGMKPFDVKWTLKKDKWDINRAINDLMTQSFMEESGTRPRGIEAFSESDLPSQSRKGVKKNKRRNHAMDDLSSPITPDSPTGSMWDIGKQDVEFIATRTGKSPKEIGSLYHKNGASIRATIVALLEAQVVLKSPSGDDPMMESMAIDLSHEFPNIPPHLLQPLCEITKGATANAHELARALVYQPTSGQSNIQIEFRHAPLELDAALPKPKVQATRNLGLTLDTATELTTKYSKEREEAFTQARAAYRKGKSDHLMGGAAAYYSELGRTADARLRIARNAAADALVASNSSKSQLDLHGVNVQEAKRIAKERVTAWWHELGESRFNGRGVAAEYRIVTGVGRHSEGGKSKLAPAILRMLMVDGWKVQVETGVLVVTGIVAKRK